MCRAVCIEHRQTKRRLWNGLPNGYEEEGKIARVCFSSTYDTRSLQIPVSWGGICCVCGKHQKLKPCAEGKMRGDSLPCVQPTQEPFAFSCCPRPVPMRLWPFPLTQKFTFGLHRVEGTRIQSSQKGGVSPAYTRFSQDGWAAFYSFVCLSCLQPLWVPVLLVIFGSASLSQAMAESQKSHVCQIE